MPKTNNFCAPCAMKTIPTTTRRIVRPSAVRWGAIAEIPIIAEVSLVCSPTLSRWCEEVYRRRQPGALEQLVQRNWQVPYTHTGRVIHGVGDRRRDARHPDLADPLRPDRIDVWILLVDEMHLDRRDIRMHGNEIFREISVYISSGPRIRNRLLQQRHADPERDSP